MVTQLTTDTMIYSNYLKEKLSLKIFLLSIVASHKENKFWSNSKVESLRKFCNGDTSEKVARDVSYVLFFYVTLGEVKFE